MMHKGNNESFYERIVFTVSIVFLLLLPFLYKNSENPVYERELLSQTQSKSSYGPVHIKKNGRARKAGQSHGSSTALNHAKEYYRSPRAGKWRTRRIAAIWDIPSFSQDFSIC